MERKVRKGITIKEIIILITCTNFYNNNNSNNYQLSILKAEIIYKKSRIKLVKIDIICFYNYNLYYIFYNKFLIYILNHKSCCYSC